MGPAVYPEAGQRESAKSIHLNVSVRAGAIGAVFWKLPGCRGNSRAASGKVPAGKVPYNGCIERERWCYIPREMGWVLEEKP